MLKRARTLTPRCRPVQPVVDRGTKAGAGNGSDSDSGTPAGFADVEQVEQPGGSLGQIARRRQAGVTGDRPEADVEFVRPRGDGVAAQWQARRIVAGEHPRRGDAAVGPRGGKTRAASGQRGLDGGARDGTGTQQRHGTARHREKWPALPWAGRRVETWRVKHPLADVFELSVPAGGQSLHYDGPRQRYLPEIVFRGRVEHRNSQYALYAAACRRGGLDVDLDSDTSWWGAPLWIYTTYALIIYARAASDATSTNLAAIADTLEQRHPRTAT